MRRRSIWFYFDSVCCEEARKGSSTCRRCVGSLFVLIAVAVSICWSGVAHAHFLWLKGDTIDGKPQAVLIFGESAADEAYHLPESLADTEIWCRMPVAIAPS